MKLLTILIPCYNSEKYIDNCVKNLFDERVDILMVDDGSTDRTYEILESYKEKYPSIVRVIHQENGGHGEGINQGIKNAIGKYFKVLDSDDHFNDDYKLFLDRLEEVDKEGGVDLFLTNYYYVHDDGKNDRAVRYNRFMPKDRVFGWEDTKKFAASHFITIHTTTFKTDVLRESKVVLPKHISYEDNYYIYAPLPLVKKMYYLDINLYQYSIGRLEQSTSKINIVKKYEQQLLVSSLIGTHHHIFDPSFSKMQQKYFYHETYMMYGIVCILGQISDDKEAYSKLSKMWDEFIEFDPIVGKKMRYRSFIRLIMGNNFLSRGFCRFLYWLSHSVIKFN